MNARESVHACWNAIGIRGDGSCAELQTHVHCRNCPVYSAAARALLEIPLPADHLAHWTAHYAQPARPREQARESSLIFRLGAEWLALPTGRCLEVAGPRAIHSLPHRRNGMVLGLTNVRGELVVCICLRAVVGAADMPAPRERARRDRLGSPQHRQDERLLVVGGERGPIALRVDDVHGTHRFDPRELQPVPDTLAAAGMRFAKAVLAWEGRTVGLLDERLLLGAIERELG